LWAYRLPNRSHYVIIIAAITTLLWPNSRQRKSPIQLKVLGKTSCAGQGIDRLDYDRIFSSGQASLIYHPFFANLKRPVSRCSLCGISFLLGNAIEPFAPDRVDQKSFCKGRIGPLLPLKSKKAAPTAFFAQFYLFAVESPAATGGPTPAAKNSPLIGEGVFMPHGAFNNNSIRRIAQARRPVNGSNVQIMIWLYVHMVKWSFDHMTT
jgi:hypothetical protein